MFPESRMKRGAGKSKQKAGESAGLSFQRFGISEG
jgi:hypothetical protein